MIHVYFSHNITLGACVDNKLIIMNAWVQDDLLEIKFKKKSTIDRVNCSVNIPNTWGAVKTY